MHPLVQDEALVVFEELPALPALVRPLSVHLPVPNEEVDSTLKAFPHSPHCGPATVWILWCRTARPCG